MCYIRALPSRHMRYPVVILSVWVSLTVGAALTVLVVLRAIERARTLWVLVNIKIIKV